MLDALAPHGFNKEMYKTLTKDANNHRMPIAFGRHAPKKGANVIGIDLRALHTPTMQRAICRIDTALQGLYRRLYMLLASARLNLAERSVALDRAGITVFRDITFLAAGPASERSRSMRLEQSSAFGLVVVA